MMPDWPVCQGHPASVLIPHHCKPQRKHGHFKATEMLCVMADVFREPFCEDGMASCCLWRLHHAWFMVCFIHYGLSAHGERLSLTTMMPWVVSWIFIYLFICSLICVEKRVWVDLVMLCYVFGVVFYSIFKAKQIYSLYSILYIFIIVNLNLFVLMVWSVNVAQSGKCWKPLHK